MKQRPIPVHGFVPADTADKNGVRDCAVCPFGEDRTDVHTYPDVPEQQQHRERIGERE